MGDLAARFGDEHATFDLLAYAGSGGALVPRPRRAGSRAVLGVLAKYVDLHRKALQGLVEKFASEGVEALDNADLLRLAPFSRMGTPVELVRAFGGRAKLDAALAGLEAALHGDGA